MHIFEENHNLFFKTIRCAIIRKQLENNLKEKEQNLLYKTIGLKAQGLQNINTGKLENLSFIEFVDYSPVYDEKYMQECVEKATPAWADVKDVDKWINELRGVA